MCGPDRLRPGIERDDQENPPTMAVEDRALIDRARTLSLPVEWIVCAAEKRGMSRFVFPDAKIDKQLIPSGHLLPPESP